MCAITGTVDGFTLAHITTVLSIKGMSTSPKVTLERKLGSGETDHASVFGNFVVCSVTVTSAQSSIVIPIPINSVETK